ncbi:hypothetical protein [Nitrosomonas sp. Is79A3]
MHSPAHKRPSAAGEESVVDGALGLQTFQPSGYATWHALAGAVFFQNRES